MRNAFTLQGLASDILFPLLSFAASVILERILSTHCRAEPSQRLRWVNTAHVYVARRKKSRLKTGHVLPSIRVGYREIYGAIIEICSNLRPLQTWKQCGSHTRQPAHTRQRSQRTVLDQSIRQDTHELPSEPTSRTHKRVCKEQDRLHLYRVTVNFCQEKEPKC